MRITNNMKIDMSLNNITAHNERLAKLQEQVSTGKRINRPSDDPVGMMNSIRFSSEKTSLDIYNNNLIHAKTYVNDSDAMAADASRVLTRFKELSLRGVNGSLTQSDRDLIAKEMNSLIEQLITDANYKNSEGFIFAGSKSDRQPFSIQMGSSRQVVKDGRVITESSVVRVDYEGDRSAIMRNESDISKLKINLDGDEAFMGVFGQQIYSTRHYEKADKGPFDDRLREGYFTIRGPETEDIIKVNANDSVESIADRINKLSKNASARVIYEKQGARLVVEAREKGATNQFALIEGATKFPRNVTNALELLGLTSKLQSTGTVSDHTQPLSTQLKELRGGGFYLNGQFIDVVANKDSLQDLVDRINSKVRNVNAKAEEVKDAGGRITGHRLVLEGTGTLTLGDAATNLFEKLGVPKSRMVSTLPVADAQTSAQPLSKNEWVKNGAFMINGVSVGITDAGSETLYSLRDNLNALGLGATASVQGDRFVITSGAPPNNTSALTKVEDGTSEFLKSFEFSYQSAIQGVTADQSVVTALGVAAGSQFEINGKTFTVSPLDTMRSLADKINFENLGARASIVQDAGGIRLDLSPSGIRDDLHLTEFKDVNGGNFLSTILMGNQIASMPSVTAPLMEGTLSALGISGTSFSVNGVQINYDPATDNMKKVVAEINQKVGGGTNAYINSANQLVIDSTGPVTVTDGPNSNFSQKLSITEEKIVDNNGSVEVKRASESAQSLFDILIEIRDNLYAGRTQAVANNIDDAFSTEHEFMGGLAKLEAAVTHVADIRGELGAVLNRIERTEKRNKDMELYIGKLIASNDEIDFEKAVVEYNTADLVYKSSIQIGARINQSTLLDFLR